MDYTRILSRLSVTLVILFLAGLVGWYFFLRGQESALQTIVSERGLRGSIPSFSGVGGSTLKNIVAGLGFQTEDVPSGDTAPRLWKVSATPTAGFGFIAGATSTKIRFMERSTGYVFEAIPAKGSVQRLTNTLIPKVYEAVFAGDGSVIGFTVNERGKKLAFSATIAATSSADSLVPLVETSLGEGTLQVVPSQRAREILSLVEDGNGSALIRSNWNGSNPKGVFTSTLRDWQVHWLRDSVVIVQRPASGVPGNAYRVETNGALTPLVRNVPGLTVLPHPTARILLSGSDSGTLSIAVQTATSSAPLPLRTVADKCVWAPGTALIAYCAVPDNAPSSQFLDAWYRGLLHTSDSWWRIDAKAGTADLLFNPTNEGRTLDAESPAVDDGGEYIAFINARDKSLWALHIKE